MSTTHTLFSGKVKKCYFLSILSISLYLNNAIIEMMKSAITVTYTNTGTGIGSPLAYECNPDR